MLTGCDVRVAVVDGVLTGDTIPGTARHDQRDDREMYPTRRVDGRTDTVPRTRDDGSVTWTRRADDRPVRTSDGMN